MLLMLSSPPLLNFGEPHVLALTVNQVTVTLPGEWRQRAVKSIQFHLEQHLRES